MKIICVGLLLLNVLCGVQYGADPSKIQAKRLTLYQSVSPMQTAAAETSIFTFPQPFSTLPQVFYSACNFNIGNTRIIEYDVRLTNKSTTDAAFSFRVGSQTSVYQFTLSVISFTFYGITAGSVSFSSTSCANRVLSTSSCSQTFVLPFRSTPYVLYALTAIYMDNDNAGKAGDLSYSFQMSFQETATSSNLLATAGPTCRVYNFTYTYWFATVSAASSANISVSFSQNGVYTHGQVRRFSSLYSSGQLMNNQSSVIGISALKFDSKNSLNFEASFPDQNKTKVTISTTVVPLVTSQVYLYFAVMGAPYCASGQYLVSYPDSDCWTCNPAFCSSCFNTLCTSCVSTRFLNKVDFVNHAGTCQCLPGYIEIDSVCESCASTCQKCSGSVNNCTSCKYGYKLMHGNCVSLCYLMHPSGQCEDCPQGCAVCSNSVTCIRAICPSQLYYYQDTCLSLCPPATYGYNKVCRACSTNCLSCSAYENCTSCSDGTYLKASGFCFQCHESCKTCSGAGDSNCTLCVSSQPSQGKCQLIKTSYCPSGTFYNGNSCQPCQGHCLICSPNLCLKCSSSYLLSDNKCLDCNTQPGLSVINGSCQQICGDGLKIFAECDDGNANNGDGCSSTCTLESEYICESNPQLNAGDLCYKKGFVPWAKVSRNLVQNKIKISFTSEISNLKSVVVGCYQKISSARRQNNYQVAQSNISNPNSTIILAFHQNFQGHSCRINISSRLQILVLVETIPQSYFLPLQPQIIILISDFLKILIIIILVSCVLFFFFVPFLVSPFYCYICLFYIGHLNYRGTPIIMYSLASNFSWITLTPENSSKNPYSVRSYLQLQEDLLSNSWPPCLLFGLTIIILLVLNLTKKRLSKKMKILFRTPIKQPLRFFHSCVFTLQPILVTRMIFVARNAQGLNILIVVVYFIFSLGGVVLLYCILKKKKQIVLASDGPVVRIIVYLYALLLTKFYKINVEVGSLITALFVLFIISSRICCQIRTYLQKKKQQEHKSQQGDKSNISDTLPSRKLYSRIELTLKFVNDFFFLFDNFLIFYFSLRPQGRLNRQRNVSVAKLTTFTAFVLINIALIAWAAIMRIRDACRMGKIHPSQKFKHQLKKGVPNLKDKQPKLQIKASRLMSIPTSLKIRKISTSISVDELNPK